MAELVETGAAVGDLGAVLVGIDQEFVVDEAAAG